VHPSAHAAMAYCVKQYMPPDRHYRVVDFGSRLSRGQTLTHRDLLGGHDCEITGIDIRDGRNVDVVMDKPYRVPLPRSSADVIFAGQVFEHVPFFWASMLELARVLKRGGYLFMTVPSRGHVHSYYDCWRYYPDGLRAMAAFSGLQLCEAYTDFPPTKEGRKSHDYGAIDARDAYWGDTVGVFMKSERYPSARIAVVRWVVRWWANRIGDLSGVPAPPPRAIVHPRRDHPKPAKRAKATRLGFLRQRAGLLRRALRRTAGRARRSLGR
jgi:SAM-dependent methyltransferase